MADGSFNIDSLSDFEILDKLKDLGCNLKPEPNVTRRALSSKLKRLLNSRKVIPRRPGNRSSMQYSSGDDTQPEEVSDATRPPSRRKNQRMPDQGISPTKLRSRTCPAPPNATLSISTKQKIVFVGGDRKGNEFSESDSDVDVGTNQDPIPLSLESPHFSSHCTRNDERRRSGSTIKEDLEQSEDSSIREMDGQVRSGDQESTTSLEKDGHRSKYTCPPLYQHLLRDLPDEHGKRSDRAQFLVQSVTIIGVIGIVYYVGSRSFNESLHLAAFDQEKSVYPICGRENVDSAICVEDVQLMPALDLANILVPKLQADALEAFCNPGAYGRNVVIPSMNEEEALAYLKLKLPLRKSAQLEKDLKNFKILVLANPNWEVQVVANGITEIERILFYGEFSAKHVSLPFICYVNRLLYSIPSIILFVCAIALSIYVISHVYTYNVRLQENQRKNTYRMVNHILEAVYEQRKDSNSPDFICVDTCRDLVFNSDPDLYSENEWEDAVDFVNKYEARVHMEVRNVQGDLVRVWTWVPTPEASPASD